MYSEPDIIILLFCRPPPTYDESLKHINPDTQPQHRPPDPPPYSESFRARSDAHSLSMYNGTHGLFFATSADRLHTLSVYFYRSRVKILKLDSLYVSKVVYVTLLLCAEAQYEI